MAAPTTNQTEPIELHKRVLLTSNGCSTVKLKNALLKLVELRKEHLSDAVALYIADGLVGDGLQPSRAQSEAERWGKSLGLSVDNIRGIVLGEATPEVAQSAFENVDVIFAECGNTFALRHGMRVSGADSIIQTLVNEEGVIYVGSSAGSIVAGKSIKVATWKGWDDPAVVECDWENEENCLGLSLVDVSIFPHMSERFRPLVNLKKVELDHDVITLSDTEGYVVYGHGSRILED